MVRRWLLVNVVLIVAFSSIASAELPQGIQSDFSSISGLVLLDRGGEVLIDLTADKGGRVGDLYSVISKGMAVKHPQTGELVGSLDEVVGLIQIIQLRPGFSIAQRVTGNEIKPGTEVHRFDRVMAEFVDGSGVGEALFIELRAALPNLHWQEYARADKATFESSRANKVDNEGLRFFYDGQSLEVRDSRAALLSTYSVTVDTPLKQIAEVAPAVPAGTVVKAEAPVTAVVPTSHQKLTAKWLGAGAKHLPVGLAVADLDGDGKQEIARVFEDRLEIGRLTGDDYDKLFVHKFQRKKTVVALSALDLNKNGLVELFVTLTVEDDLRSEVLEFKAGKYVVIAKNQPWFLNVIELPGPGQVLLGQRRDRSYYGFAPDIQQLEWDKGQLHGTGEFALPEQGVIYSLAALPFAGKDRFARINSDGRIEVFSLDDGELWVSEKKGYSETSFLQADAQNPSFDEEFLHRVFLPTALISGPEGSVITAMNDGRIGSDKFRQMRTLSLIGWKWKNQEMYPEWELAEMDGYVPAMTIADADNDGQDELVLLIAHPGSIFSTRKSVVKLFQLP